MHEERYLAPNGHLTPELKAHLSWGVIRLRQLFKGVASPPVALAGSCALFPQGFDFSLTKPA